MQTNRRGPCAARNSRDPNKVIAQRIRKMERKFASGTNAIVNSSLAVAKPREPSGPEIRAVRVAASKRQDPTRRRVRAYRRKLDTPSHFGAKQQAKYLKAHPELKSMTKLKRSKS